MGLLIAWHGLGAQKVNQVLQAGKALPFTRARTFERGAPDLFFSVAGLPQAQQVRKVTLLFFHSHRRLYDSSLACLRQKNVKKDHSHVPESWV